MAQACLSPLIRVSHIYIYVYIYIYMYIYVYVYICVYIYIYIGGRLNLDTQQMIVSSI